MYSGSTEDNLMLELKPEVIEEVIKTGTDLRQYSKEVEKKLRECENKSIQDYIKESQNIVNLHNRINSCDDILERMENMLLNFKSDLGNISSEIISLQKKSVEMNQRLNNRQSVRGHLSQFIDDISVSEEHIRIILEADVTDKEFIKQLSVLSQKINFVREQNTAGINACQDVKEVLEMLKIKAVTKIRAYIMEQISKLRRPMTNYHMPQNALLKHKLFFEFLLTNEIAVAHEICNEYVDTMGKVYFSYFKSYSSNLKKLQFEEAASKEDLLGASESSNRGFFSKSSLKQKNTVFTIGNRGDILSNQLEAPVIIPHSAHQQETRYPFEALFRSQQYALLDNACREYLFICEFFTVKGDAALELFKGIMTQTLNLLTKNLETFVENCYDLIALLLCYHISLRYMLMCHKRAVPALDDYWNKMEPIIMARFEHVMRLNIESVRICDPNKFKQDMNPHYITRRYAELSAAIISIDSSYPNEMVTKLLAALLEEVQCFILKMAAIFTGRKEQLIFLINNYDLALNIITERIRNNSKEVDSFRSLVDARSIEYVEEILSPHFGGIIQYVREGENLLERNLMEELKKQEGKQKNLVQQFCDNWKASLDNINRTVLSSFPNLVTGSSLLQLAFTQLIQYCNRFTKLLTPAVKPQFPNIHLMLHELKKYKTNF
ncbi:vacuolar protein sorting-associated protein 52 homolog [Planococcus citri]|uniref:vacuolar protein sorting-associated protein 52 homolog n=1 Tax=Planococcus citri TaxID=170843 RepID=UPI0031F8EF9A